MPNRYNIAEDENFEPESDNQVLKNYLGIKNKQVIEALEEKELSRTGLERMVFNLRQTT